MIILFALLSALAAGTEEPDPINEEEQNDEIAQAQTRSRMLACLNIARNLVDQHPADVQAVIDASAHGKKETKKKVLAQVVYKCYQMMDNKFAEVILLDDYVELSRNELQGFVNLDKQQFADPASSVELTAEEAALLKEMKDIAESKDPEFDKDPPPMGSDDIKML